MECPPSTSGRIPYSGRCTSTWARATRSWGCRISFMTTASTWPVMPQVRARWRRRSVWAPLAPTFGRDAVEDLGGAGALLAPSDGAQDGVDVGVEIHGDWLGGTAPL